MYIFYITVIHFYQSRELTCVSSSSEKRLLVCGFCGVCQVPGFSVSGAGPFLNTDVKKEYKILMQRKASVNRKAGQQYTPNKILHTGQRSIY